MPHGEPSGRQPTLRDIALYSIPGVVAYLQLVILPKWTSNFLIVAYVLVGSALLARVTWSKTDTPTKKAADTHFGQHVIFCLLYMALGIYL